MIVLTRTVYGDGTQMPLSAARERLPRRPRGRRARMVNLCVRRPITFGRWLWRRRGRSLFRLPTNRRFGFSLSAVVLRQIVINLISFYHFQRYDALIVTCIIRNKTFCYTL